MDDIWVSHLTFQYMLDGRNHLVYRTQNSSIWMLIDTFEGSTRYVFKYPLKVTLDELIWPCLKTFPKFKKDNCPKWYKAWVWYSPAVIKHTKTFITISGTNTWNLLKNFGCHTIIRGCEKWTSVITYWAHCYIAQTT